jgi:putative Mn2+ efflux pump MntP
MDAFAVALASGIAMKQVSPRQTFRLAWHFGFFQFMMPVIGWAGGRAVHTFIQEFDHWVAFAFLSFIGIKMILESRSTNQAQTHIQDPTKGLKMVMLSIATSLDALTVGLSLSMLRITIWFPAIIIGIVALLFTAVGLHLGRWAASASSLGKYAEFLGGFILLGIGVNILYQHGAFSFLWGG